MTKVSRENAQVDDHVVVEDRHGEIDGYAINFMTYRQDIDVAPLMEGLPDGRCQCPHWGYVFTGKLTFRHAGHEESYEAGDAFYVAPGHIPAAEPGTEFVQFSPADELRIVSETLTKNARKMLQRA